MQEGIQKAYKIDRDILDQGIPEPWHRLNVEPLKRRPWFRGAEVEC